jgi:hypothetical protein
VRDHIVASGFSVSSLCFDGPVGVSSEIGSTVGSGMGVTVGVVVLDGGVVLEGVVVLDGGVVLEGGTGSSSLGAGVVTTRGRLWRSATHNTVSAAVTSMVPRHGR